MVLEVTSPYDGSVVCEVPHDDATSVEGKLFLARKAFSDWSRRPLAQRREAVQKGVEWFRANKEEVARDVSRQMGKPISQSRREVDTLLERAGHMLDICEEALSPDILPDRPGLSRRIEHRPLGVVLDVAAWNYPLLIPVNVVVPALLAGNVVLLKHSAKTPLCGRHFARAFAEAGEGLVQDLVGTHEDTARVIADPRVDYVAFTGSVSGGREVYRVCAERLIDCGLELGGKDPAYVAEDGDLDHAAENVVDGACYNAGQSCCAVERVYVHEKVYDAFVEKAAAALDAYVLGDPLDEKTSMGPLASASAPAFLEAQVRQATSRGARLEKGGARLDRPGSFFPPTMLTGCKNDTDVMQEESFGPLVPILKVASDDEAVRLMNDSRFGLTASVWTRDVRRAERIAAALLAGTLYQNRCDYLDPALPWTGVKDSGFGSTLSRYGFYHLTRRTSIHFRTQT